MVVSIICVVIMILGLGHAESHRHHHGGKYLKINPNTVTVSGISSGAFFAVQYHIAFSSLIRGAGIVAGGPYYCGEGESWGAELCLNAPETINVNSLVSALLTTERNQYVDPLSNIADQTLHLWSGTSDSLVPQAVMNSLVEMYGQLNATRLTKEFSYPAQHGWVTNKYGNPCGQLGSPYIVNCDYDFAGQFLSRAWKNMGLNFTTPKGALNLNHMYEFAQSDFGANPGDNSMQNTAFIYVPRQCRKTTCHLHINFHGCVQGKYTLGSSYVTQTEINEWAEVNNIVVLYPQVESNILKGNPEGCWDWWGYDDSLYATKNGTQMSIVNSMMETLIEGRFPAPGGSPNPPPPPPPPGPNPPGPAPPTPPTPPAPATCSGRTDGSTCLSASEYILCPVGLTMQCLTGMTCSQISPGAGVCL